MMRQKLFQFFFKPDFQSYKDDTRSRRKLTKTRVLSLCHAFLHKRLSVQVSCTRKLHANCEVWLFTAGAI